MNKSAFHPLTIIATSAWLLVTAGPCYADANELEYDLRFNLSIKADRPRAEASIELRQAQALLRNIRLRAPQSRYSDFRGDGLVERDGEHITWVPPASGGRLSYTVLLEHQRANGAYDALVTETSAIFRLDDVFPAARTRHLAGAHSRSSLKLSLPQTWSVTTPFPDNTEGGYSIINPTRAFDRPTGWLAAGKLGRRRDLISGVDVTITAPIGAGAQRIPMLALLRWTLPTLTREISPVPDRLSIVVDGEPMWRGGLSAGNSVFVHADRPLLSENGTSTLLHEVVHMMMPLSTRKEHDWIDEGIAEYITLRLLRDSGTISAKRFAGAIKHFDQRGLPSSDLENMNASGDITARAVVIFHALDNELIRASNGADDLFTLLRLLRASAALIGPEELDIAARELTGLEKIKSLPILTR